MDAASLIGLSQFGQPTLGELAGSHADVVAELHDLSPVQTAATFSGLLVRPELQANCLRVEALAHFAAMHSCGSKAPTQGFVRRSFDCLSEGYCGMAEDPVEDLFVRLVSTPNGNFRVFEGIREANAFHLQNILNVVEGMPTGGPFEQLCVSIDSLLKISDLVAQRAGVLENILGKEFPLKSLPADLIADPSRLRRLVRFTARDLDRLQIQRDTLAEFALDFQGRDRMAAQTFGHTDLERHPFAFLGESIYLLLPTAIGSAITRFVIEFVTSIGKAEVFELALAENFARTFRDTPLLGNRMPIGFQTIEGGQIGTAAREVDLGRYLNIIFYVDSLQGFAEYGFCGANAAPEALASAVSLNMRRIAEAANTKPGFIDGITLFVGCGYGRGLVLALEDDLPENWRFESVSAYDLATLSWFSDFDLLCLWRIFGAQDALVQSGTELFNVNGLLNLVAWAIENKGHLVPHGQLPNDFVQEGGHRLITINQNSLRDLRHSVITQWDSRRILDTSGRWVAVKKCEKTYFEEDNAAPLYVSMEIIRGGRLRAVYNSAKRPWWIEVLGPKSSDTFSIYERWNMLCTWLRRAAPILDSVYLRLPEGPISLRVSFAEIVAVTEGRATPKSPDELRSLIAVTARGGESDIRIDIQEGFEDGLEQPDNIAERVLVEALVKGAATAGGEQENAEKVSDVTAAICPNSEMRYMHRFAAQNFRDFLRSEIGRKPLLVNQFDHSACLLGLGWRHRPRELGPEIQGVADCTSYLNTVVENQIGQICEILRGLDRRAVIDAVLLNHEAACCDRDIWRRTALANIAIHRDTSAARSAIVEHDGRLGVCLTLTRILIEAAICVCPLQGGRSPGELDFSRLMSLAFLVFQFGGDSDAVYWGAMEPSIRVTPLGDVHMNRSFQDTIYDPFVRAGGAVQLEHAAEKYPGLYAPASVRDSVVGFLDDRFLRAWQSEFGVSVDGIRKFIEEVGGIGLERNEPMLHMAKSSLVALLAKSGAISADQASEALALWILQTRPQWAVAPDGFENRDWQPWRFRRRLSVLRRPFFEIEPGRDPELVFAPGLVSDAFMATIMWFHNGDIHQSETRSAEMESWIGHVNNENGNKFTREVETKLKELGWRTESEIYLTNVLSRGCDDRFGDLKRYGDIDVLAWRDDLSRVLAIECKDVQFRKTPGEVAEQLADFRGEVKPTGKPDLLRRHLNRIEVLNANTDAVAKKLKLTVPISVEGHLVFKNPVPMQYAWDHLASRIKLSIFSELHQL